MSVRRRQVRINAAAFLVLCLASLYRQLSLRFMPGDFCRTYILYYNEYASLGYPEL